MNVSPMAARGAADSNVAGRDRRDQILDVACDLFFSKGFGAASMRDVANKIGFTQAAIYYHFDSKDAILFALIDDFTSQLLDHLKRVMHATDDPVRDLAKAVRTHILLSRTHYREIKLVIEDKKLLSGPFLQKVRERELGIYDLYRGRIEDVKSAVDCAPIDTAVVAFTLLGAINFAYQWYRPDGAMELEAIAEQTGALVIGGLISSLPDGDTRPAA